MKFTHTREEATKTVLIITLGFCIIFFLSKQNWALYVALSVGILGAISTFLADYIHWAWTKLGWLLSLIVPKILMTIIYYLILTPIALLSRLFGKSDPLELKNAKASFFKERVGEFTKESFEKPW